jgi:hypothetical protein
MNSKKALSIIEASVVVALMLILALGGLYGGKFIIVRANAADCVKNLGSLYNLKRTAYHLDELNIAITVANLISAEYFCNSSDSTDNKYSNARYMYDYDLVIGDASAMPECKSNEGTTSQINHELIP